MVKIRPFFSYFALFLLLFLFGAVNFAFAQGVEYSPLIIDEKMKPGDVIDYEVKLKNKSSSTIELYAQINDFSKEKGFIRYAQTSDLDKNTSPARWLGFTRGAIEFQLGEEKIFPLEFDIEKTAVPGQYHSYLSFASGSSRAEAESKMGPGAGLQIPINIIIDDTTVEKLEVAEFTTIKKIFLKPEASFSVKLKNIGNAPIKPGGEIIIYDKNNKEIDALPINEYFDEISPSKEAQQIITWKAPSKPQKYKARLFVEYGSKNKQNAEDIIFFYVIPFVIFALFVALVILIIILVIILVKYLHPKHPAHYAKKNSK